MSNLIEELKRRNVYKVATAYAITSWLVIQVVNTIGPNLSWSDNIASIITKALIVGFPIALILAWLYEFTPQGIKRTGTIQEKTIDNKKAGKRLNRLIITSLTLVIVLMLVERFFFASPLLNNDIQQASIAVLPFVNMSNDEKNDYIADGLSAEILNELANIDDFKVPARTSSFMFKNKNEDIKSIASKLGVNYLLAGSIRFDGDIIRVTAQLINAYNGYHLWSKTYDNALTEILTVQTDISKKVANEILFRLLPKNDVASSGEGKIDPEALKLYFKAKELAQKRDDSSIKEAIKLLQEAVALDPNFARAHAEIVYHAPNLNFYGDLSKDEMEKLMNEHLSAALKIDPELPEVLWAKSRYDQEFTKDSTRIIADLRKALDKKPNFAAAYFSLSSELQMARQPKLSHESLLKANELDPYNNFYSSILARELFVTYRDPEKALQIINKILEEEPYAGGLTRFKAWILSASYGQNVESFKLMYELIKRDPYNHGNLTWFIGFTLNLDLSPMAKKYSRIMQLKYPVNNETFYRVLEVNYFERKFKENIDLIKFWSSEKGLDDYTKSYELVWCYISLGEFDVAKTILDNAFPEQHEAIESFKQSSSIIIDGDYVDIIDLYIYILRGTNDNDLAGSLAENLCNYYNKEMEAPLFRTDTELEYTLNCLYASNSKSELVKKLDQTFFIQKNRFKIFQYLKSGYYPALENDPEYQSLYKRIEQETHRMRNEVITYLKEQGDWDSSWNKELGLTD